MSGRRKKSRTSSERFLRLTHSMLNHPAWKDLSGNDVKLLLDVWKRFNGGNNGEISYSVREAADLLHCSKDTAARSFQSLCLHGFLEVSTKGAFSMKTRHATTWRLTCEHARGKSPTHDYTHWMPEGDALETALAAREKWRQRQNISLHGEKQNTVLTEGTGGPS